MIYLDHVTKYYGDSFAAVKDVSLRIEAGEVGVLLGPNGAGKSTLIKCICGLLRHDGDIALFGHGNRSIEAKALLGYIPETPAIYPMLTVSEHMEFIARAYKLDNWQERSLDLLVRFEMDDKRQKLGKELSKGMQQKLSICCALLPDPKVVIFDEPYVGLDPHAIRELKALMGELRGAGCSLLVSTHMIDSMEHTWDTTHIMVKGRIAVTRHREELGDESLEDLFFRVTEGDYYDLDVREEENS